MTKRQIKAALAAVDDVRRVLRAGPGEYVVLKQPRLFSALIKFRRPDLVVQTR
jgi:hypothetical protein